MRKLKNIYKALMTGLLLVILSSSCTKELREQEYGKQEKLIESFVKSLQSRNPDCRVFHQGGSTRITLAEGEGVEVTASGKAVIRYALYDFSSGSASTNTLVATNASDSATTAGWELTDKEYSALEIQLSDKDILTGLRNGLEGVRQGEECWILFSGKYAFGKSKVGTIPANAPLAYHVWVETIEN